MLEKHAAVIREIAHDPSVCRLVRQTFHIPREPLLRGLERRRVDQASVVLVLLHTAEGLPYVEALVGKPITKCPPARRFHLSKALMKRMREQESHTGDLRRVLAKGPNRRMPTSPAWHRYNLIRPGLTISQLLVRGVTRRDIRGAIRRKWIIVED